MSSSYQLVKKFLYVSTDKSNIDSVGDYSFPLSQPLNRLRSIRLVSYNIPWTFINVNYGNNVIKFDEQPNGGPVRHLTATIAEGQYTTTYLCAAIMIAMNAASGGANLYQLSASTTTNKLRFWANTSAFTIVSTGTTASQLIGLGSGNITSAPAENNGHALTMRNTYDLLPVKQIHILLPGLVRGITVQGIEYTNPLIQVVSLSNNRYGDYIENQINGEEFDVVSSTINTLTVSITDENGYTPQFTEQIPMSFTFQLTYERSNLDPY